MRHTTPEEGHVRAVARCRRPPALTRHAAGVPRRPAAAQQGDPLPSRPTHGRPGRDCLGLGIGVVGLAIAAAATARVSDASDWAFDLLLLSVAWGMGRLVRGRQLQVAQAERERDERGRAAAAEERSRIARELHDLVAHGVSVMGIQAGAAQALVDRDPEAARAAMLAVERMSRDALTRDASPRRRAPRRRRRRGRAARRSRGSATSPRCSATFAAPDFPVELTIEGDRRDLPAGLELSAYRIVQEALTNSLKHAGPATATVSVRYRADDLELRIADTGAARAARGDSRRRARHPRHA